MKKEYIYPNIEISEIESEDIICSSPDIRRGSDITGDSPEIFGDAKQIDFSDSESIW